MEQSEHDAIVSLVARLAEVLGSSESAGYVSVQTESIAIVVSETAPTPPHDGDDDPADVDAALAADLDVALPTDPDNAIPDDISPTQCVRCGGARRGIFAGMGLCRDCGRREMQ